jgi:glycerol-1-phosphate dehydrogenase [NAD(P)+]
VPRDLGLSEDEFLAAVMKAPSTRPDRYTILEHLDMDEAQARGRVGEFVGAFDR